MNYLFRTLIALLLILPAQFAFSASYTWTVIGHGNHTGSSPMSAAQAAKSSNGWVSIDWCSRQTDMQFVCRTNWQPGGWYFNFTVVRSGDSCSDPEATYKPETGECVPPEPDECESKKDQSTTFTKSGRAPDSYAIVLPQGSLGPNQSACFSSCVVSTADQKCKVNTDGQYTCQGVAYYTGQKCTTGPVVDFTDSPKLPEPEVTTKDKPCQYIEQSDGTLRCDSEKSTEKEGQHCGTVNGVKKCFDTKPTKDGIDIKTEVKTETKPDGSTVTTKTDTATKTTCSGINSCKSTTTTTTTTTEKDPNGKTNSITGSCTGEACPDKNTNPDGDGDGFGDCTGTDCGDSSGGSFETPEFEEVGTISDTTSAFIDRIGDSPILSTVSSIGLNGQGSCSMGSTSTSIGTISASSVCDNSHWLDSLYFIFLAVHALAAVRVLLSA